MGAVAAFMRELTLEIAADADTWTSERASQITSLFDSVATAWPERDRPERHDALRDALARGGTFPNGLCVEVGAGTGNASGDLRAAFGTVISMDLSREMLALASRSGTQVQATHPLFRSAPRPPPSWPSSTCSCSRLRWRVC